MILIDIFGRFWKKSCQKYFFRSILIWGGDYIRKLTREQKLETTGGSFYAIALGIGILVSTVSSLVGNIIASSKSTPEQTAYGYRRSTIMRLSPVPSRSSISIIG